MHRVIHTFSVLEKGQHPLRPIYTSVANDKACFVSSSRPDILQVYIENYVHAKDQILKYPQRVLLTFIPQILKINKSVFITLRDISAAIAGKVSMRHPLVLEFSMVESALLSPSYTMKFAKSLLHEAEMSLSLEGAGDIGYQTKKYRKEEIFWATTICKSLEASGYHMDGCGPRMS
jgi:hypothetical protein